MSKPRNPAIYARISHDPDETRLGVERQVQACHDEAAKRGWAKPVEYVDNDASAYNRRVKRPMFERLLDDIEHGEIDGIIVWHDDRLTRQPRDFERFLDACEQRGITNNYVTATGNSNLSTPDGIFTARLMANIANFESAHKSERVKAKRREEAAAGKPQTGGVRPFGYLADKRTPHPVEGPVVTELARRHLAGESVATLARWLVDQEVATVNGGDWSYGSVVRILTNPRYASLRRHRGVVVAKGDWPALISEADHRAISARHVARQQRPTREPRTYLLTGLIHCGRCGHRLMSMPSKGVRRYVCPTRVDGRSCAGVSINADPVERLVAQVVLYRLDSPDLAQELDSAPGTDADDAEVTIRGARQELVALQAAYDADELNLQEWLGAKKKHERVIDSAQSRLATLGRTRSASEYLGLGAQLAEVWTDYDIGRQRAIVDAVVDRVEVRPVGRGKKVAVSDRLDIRFGA
ncbi:MAG: Resolvase domain protein [Marmoricola sp.]|nr:Resolvase domain protein [Marmoricola sp.]